MNRTEYVLGIDTSNYKTSVAVIDSSRNIICDIREFLKVKTGERGLRQSDALFQHVKMLPELIRKIRDEFDGSFSAAAYSSKPRPVENSYMPVFLAGKCAAESIAASMNIPVFSYSHQEGHIEAVKTYSPFADKDNIMACHFSGGTCELLKINKNPEYRKSISEKVYDIEIAGGSYDISFGQVIDRAGVLLGMDFPAGRYMDDRALNAEGSSRYLTRVKSEDAWINLSGLDTQMRNTISRIPEGETDSLIRELFERIGDAMVKMLVQGADKTGIKQIIMTGGVSSSCFIRKYTADKAAAAGLELFFDDNDLSQDNAVGTALLGGMELWD